MWNERLCFAGTPAPTARQLGSFASVASAVYSSGGFYVPGTPVALQPVTPTYLEVYYGPAVAATASPTLAPTFAPCAVTAPTNGALGTCASSLAQGATCQFTCSAGYGVSGPTSCSSSTGLLAAATCTFEEAWTTVRAVPSKMTNVGQACAVVGSLLYTYTTNFPSTPQTTAFQKYAAAIDVWTSGAAFPAPALAYHKCPFERCVVCCQRLLLTAWFFGAVKVSPSWDNAATFTGGFWFLSAASQLDFMYVFDHYNYYSATVPVQVLKNYKYSVSTDVWTTMKTSPTGRIGATSAGGYDHGASAANVMNRIYLMGGNVAPGAGSKNEAFSPLTDTWTTVASLPIARGGAAIGVKFNKVYVAGGSTNIGITLTSAMSVYDPATDVWTTGPVPDLRAALLLPSATRRCL